VLALLCAIAAVGCLVSGFRDDDPAAASSPEPAATVGTRTPLLSARRAPALFLGEVAKARLSRSLHDTVSPYDSCVVVAAPSGERLATVGTPAPLAAASNQKLLLAAAALEVLGADHRLTTRAVTDAPLEGETLRGDLTLVGGGDPLLATGSYEQYLHEQARFRDVAVTRLDALADAVVSAGIRHIDGSIRADDSRFDTTRYNADWKSNYVPDGDIGPVGALTVDGGFSDPRAPVAADDPALLAAQRFRELLGSRGVTVGGGVQRGTARAGTRTVGELQSLPLADLVGVMLRASDNYAAELLTREIGYVRRGAGTTAAGLQVVLETLDALGVPIDGIELVDGSGLAPSNRVTCEALLRVLELTLRPPFDAIAAGLPVAAQTGTLATRFAGHPLAGVLRAKTGEIDGVVGLSGTVDDAEDPLFSFLANGGFSTDGGRFLQDEVGSIVAAYPDVSNLALLVPPPETPS
jgi:D-alanyl-D-alanine carboxypeptidase/D-alanyl-D-alanine-endopeptidase (penicillin-binding protein 4)